VTIINDPKNGTATVDKITGLVSYIPKTDFVGNDSFIVNICDSGTPKYCANDTIYITVNSTGKKPVVGLAKSASNPILKTDGSFDITYTLTVQNLGNEDIRDIKLYDDLKKTFPLPSTFSINGGMTVTGDLMANSGFDGLNDTTLTHSGNKLGIGASATIQFIVNVAPNGQFGSFTNQAFVSASGLISKRNSTDLSTDGLTSDPNSDGIPDEHMATLVTLDNTITIPDGFSPNADGVNDVLVIQNIEGYNATLTVFNRWGNIVYEEKNYKNEWNGKSNKGLTAGSVVPDGTYYVLVNLNNGNKPYAKAITIKK
jgi:large repetitive protein